MKLEPDRRPLPRHPRLKPPDHRAVIRVHLSCGEIRTMLGQGDLALVAYRRGGSIARVFGDDSSMADCLFGISRVHFHLDQYDQLIDTSNRSLELYRAIDDKKGIAECYNNLCYAYYALGDLTTATAHYQAAIQLHTEIGNKAGLAESYNNAGMVQARRGEYTRALEYLQSCHDIFRELDDRREVGLTLNNLGLLHSLIGDYATAIDHLQRAAALQAEIGDEVSLALSIYNMGAIRYKQDRHAEALEFMQRALQLYRKSGNGTSEVWALTFIGAAHSGEGRRDLALQELMDAQRAAAATKDDDILCRIELLLGDLKVTGPEPCSAAGHIDKLLELSERYRVRGTRAAALELRARLSTILGDVRAAESDFINAVSVLYECQMLYEWALASFHYAQFLIGQQRSDSARPHLAAARGYFEQIGNDRYVQRIADMEKQLPDNE